ncbi:MAG: YdeI/OmpD-associated family protein [Bacteroidetes bacterium]|nr:YdeI/OmpD-associated family protein [Bacteroidota bacterium]
MILQAFKENEPALFNFKKLSATQQRNYILWITQAKKEETRQKRLLESIRLLEENQKFGLK